MENIGLIGLILFFLVISFAPTIYKKIKLRNKMINKDAKYVNGYVYIISNPVFKEGIVKIGMTTHKDYTKRIKQLYNTSVPTPFNVEFIIPHKYPQQFEKFLHNKFKKYRVSTKREFFLIEREVLEKELKLLSF